MTISFINVSLKNRITIIPFLILLIFPFLGHTAMNRPNVPKKTVIVIDPGHGGHNHGAKGARGTLEKDVTLNLSLLIQKELEKDYEVLLTRRDDYWLDLAERASLANHHKADIFISIHSGGSDIHNVNGSSVYYLKKTSSKRQNINPSFKKSTHLPSENTAWADIQTRHSTTSKLLAKIMAEQITQIEKNMPRLPKGAHLTVLEGADMPAILFEIGHLTNIEDEATLNNPERLSEYAFAVSKGIKKFLATNTIDTNIIDLHE